MSTGGVGIKRGHCLSNVFSLSLKFSLHSTFLHCGPTEVHSVTEFEFGIWKRKQTAADADAVCVM